MDLGSLCFRLNCGHVSIGRGALGEGAVYSGGSPRGLAPSARKHVVVRIGGEIWNAKEIPRRVSVYETTPGLRCSTPSYNSNGWPGAF